jgi:hypothetical protein
MQYIISVNVQIRPVKQNQYGAYQEGLKIEHGAAILCDGTVTDAAAIAARFEGVFKQIAAERKYDADTQKVETEPSV